MPLSTGQARAVAAHRFRALGDETRLRLLQALKGDEQCVADLMEITQLGQSLVSHHLRTLRSAGLVTVRREGRWVFYAIAPAAITAIKGVMDALEPS